MKLNETLETLDALYKAYAPTGAALLDFIKRQDEYIVLYRDDANVCTPYIIHHYNSNGLCKGRYYYSGWFAWMEFSEMR